MLEEAKYLAENEHRYSERWKTGATAKFLQVNPLWGVKFYKYKEDREYTWNLQKKAAGVNAAPPIGDKIDSHLGYGYLTMIADVKKDKSCQDMILLKKQLKEIGIQNDDIRKDNCGYFDNKLVCIDFDCADQL